MSFHDGDEVKVGEKMRQIGLPDEGTRPLEIFGYTVPLGILIM